MSIRHYVLLATDGFIKLPTTADPCDFSTLQDLYVFGFVGGLFKVDNTIINQTLDQILAQLPFLTMIGIAIVELMVDTMILH